ncbi:MAG: hypothetical protein IPQ09_17525 [Myxococcales bacterium]|nr:hypothetical protein [Myxococcales bacterium]
MPRNDDDELDLLANRRERVEEIETLGAFGNLLKPVDQDGDAPLKGEPHDLGQGRVQITLGEASWC